MEQGVGLHHLQGPIQPKLFSDSMKGYMLKKNTLILLKLVSLRCPFIGVKSIIFPQGPDELSLQCDAG